MLMIYQHCLDVLRKLQASTTRNAGAQIGDL